MLAAEKTEVYKIGNAVVRIHGQEDHEALKKATAEFLKNINFAMAAQSKKGGQA